jgi:hypothetical protein
MIANGTIDELRFVGLASENISNGVNGLVTEFGYLRNIDTSGTPYGQTWNDGDIIYVSPTTAGYLTNVLPVAPNLKIVVAIVIEADNNFGVLLVRPTAYSQIGDLSDVNISTVTNGDLLVYDGTDSRWENAAQSTITAGKATNLAGGATGSLPYQSAADTTTFLAAGSDGQVLKLASGVPTWSSDASGVTITDDTTTNATRYLTFTDATTGTETGLDVASTKLQFNPSNGLFTLGGTSAIKVPVGTDAERPGTPAAGMFRFNDDSDEFEGYDGTAWGAIGGGGSIPTGTVMLFYQAAAPTGWTQVTTQDNKALRVVSGVGGGTGGSVNFTTAFASQSVSGTVGDTTLTEAQMPSHNHQVNNGTGGTGSAAGSIACGRNFSYTPVIVNTKGSSAAHNHSFTGTAIDLSVQYIDVIIASKD